MTEQPSRAELLLRARLNGPEVAPAPAAASEIRSAPLTATQEGLWYESRLDPGAVEHHRPTVYRLSGPVDPVRLGLALDAVVARHAVLRTSYPVVAGRPTQLVHDPVPVELQVVDLVDLGGVDPVADAATIPFDVEAAPPFAATLVRRAPDDHLLVLAVHHLAIDGPSADVLQRDLFAAYEGLGSASPTEAPQLPPLGSTFAAWADRRAHEAGEREGSRRETDLAWWRQVLAGPLPTLPTLPTPPILLTRPSPPLPIALRPAVIVLPDSLADALRALARSESVTLFATLLAGLQSLLLEEWQLDDVVLGVPVSDRGSRDADGLVGCFVSVLPVRLRVGATDTGRTLIERAGATMISALAHGEVSFREIVAAAMPRGRDGLAISPVMGSAQLRRTQEPLSGRSGLLVERVPVAVPGPGVNLLVTDGSSLTVELSMTVDAGAPTEAGRLAAALLRHLTALVQAPDLPVARVDGPEDAIAAAPPGRPYPADVTIPELFAEVEAAHRDAVAVVDGSVSVTYGQLGDRARAMGRDLVELGVGPGHTVAVDLERSIGCVVAMLAVVLTGAAYVPLDPLSPPDRTQLVLDDADVTAIVGPDGVEPVLRPANAPLPLSPDRGPRSPVYVIYTSGSTGAPKGVVVHHRGVIHLVRTVDHVAFSPGDVIGFASSPAFDVATYEVWGALLNGGTLVVVDRETLLDPARFETFLGASGITSVHLNTALVNALVRQRPGIFAGLHELSFGGEAVEPRWIRALLEAGPPDQVLHDYGPTETTVSATRHLVTHVAADAVTVPIGGPIGQTTVHVLDEDGRPVPAGVPGELWIGGPGVALGYLNQPELTAERFVPDPFDRDDPEARLYRTGDVVVARPDGQLEFLGRVDTQVKVRGFRVELGEIENALARHPAVDLVAVHPWRRGDGTVLVAYVVPASGTSPELAGLRVHLREILPPYMVPARLVLLDRLPWTVSGKVDRAALPEPVWDGSTLGPAVGDGTDGVGRMQKIWCGIVEHHDIGVDDDFFEMGGHSLRAVALLAAVADEFGVDLRIADLVGAPTPRRLTAVVDGLAGSADRGATPWDDARDGVIELAAGDAALGTIVLIPPNSGVQLLVDYRVLARHLHTDRRIITFTPQGLAAGEAPLDTVGELARHYRARLRSVAVTGPIVLGGHSLGGTVALEMARQIRGEPGGGESGGGDVVEAVVLFDSRRFDDGAARRRILVKRPLRRMRNAVRSRLDPRRRGGETPEQAIGEAGAAATRAALTFRLRPYGGRVIYLAARGTPGSPERRRRDEGWAPQLTAMEVFEVPGRHSGAGSMLAEPHVAVTAADVLVALDGDRPAPGQAAGQSRP